METDLEVLSNDLAQVLLLSRVTGLPLDWSEWSPARRFGWLSAVLSQVEQEILNSLGVVV